jgi:twinkle protein
MGGDKTGNHLIIFENSDGESFGKCNKCGFYVPPKDFDPSKMKKVDTKSPEYTASQMAELEDCPIKSLPVRKITQAVAERFNVRSGLDQVHGKEVTSHIFPRYKDGKLTGYKVRNLDPKFTYGVGDGVGTDLFGLEQAKRSDVGNLYLWITEGEVDAMSAYQVLDEYSKTPNKPAVVSLPDGAGSVAKSLGKHADWISTFKTVVLCFDTDKAGKDAVTDALKMIPYAKVVELPDLKAKGFSDANDYLMAGKGRELFNFLLFRQEAPKIEGIISIKDCLAEALTPPSWGISYPWEGLTDLTYGQRAGEIVAVGGGVGCGKTLLAHEIAAHNWKEHQQASFMVMLEENNGQTIKNIAGKMDSTPYHLPDREFDVEKLRATANVMDGGIHLWRSSINQAIRFDFDKILNAIRYHATVNDVKHVFFDNVTAATQHLSTTEINTEVGRIAMQLAGLADELALQIFIFSHLNTPSSGASHEEGGQVREHQFTGSRALMRWCQVILGFERNKQAAGDQKHRSKIRLLKQRMYGTTGEIDTKYTHDTSRLLQIDHSEVDGKEEF